MGKKNKRTATKIMVIRHAEKPYGNYKGITAKGRPSPDSLIVKGWQRAGALAVLFDQANGSPQNSQLSAPNTLYASPAGKNSKSNRPVETITPLSRRLKIPIRKKFGRNDYKAMADQAMKQKGTVLISWQHQFIPLIANRIMGKKATPKNWPRNRYDLVWIFELDASTGEYNFSQATQNVMPNDKDTVANNT